MSEIQMVGSKVAAARLGIAEGTLRNMRIAGVSPPYAKIGAAVRYRIADLDAWLERRIVIGEEPA